MGTTGMSNKTIENQLKVYRAKYDLTQKDLAKEVGVTRQTISALEKGRYNPSLELAFEICDYFDCTVEEIFTYE